MAPEEPSWMPLGEIFQISETGCNLIHSGSQWSYPSSSSLANVLSRNQNKTGLSLEKRLRIDKIVPVHVFAQNVNLRIGLAGPLSFDGGFQGFSRSPLK